MVAEIIATLWRKIRSLPSFQIRSNPASASSDLIVRIV
jgi:hypothetical protein